MNMNRFYSSLIINSKYFPNVHQVFKPRYNKEFFKRLTANIKQLEAHIEKRYKNCSKYIYNYDLSSFKDDSTKLVKLKERLEKVEKGSLTENDPKYLDIKIQLETIEERVMPFAISIPNRSSKHVPETEVILDEIISDFADQKRNLTKVLSHTKLSYINNCYSKSVIGPNSHYYYGIGAKLQYGLSDFFTAELEKMDFIPVSGLCLTKSAVVEAANSRDLKIYATDPCRVLSENDKCTTMHLVEASRESLLGFITTIGPRSSNNPLRLIMSGASYRNGSDWFDSDDKRVTQFETVHALIHTSSIEQYSMKEYHQSRDVIWNTYKKLKLPTRLVQCSLDTMLANEYDAHRIDIWLPSIQRWVQVSRISHYLDYVTVRSGMKRGHIIDSTVYDGQALVAAIIENNQTPNGKFIIPSVIKDHMIHLFEGEQSDYFTDSVSSSSQDHYTASQSPPTAYVLNNYEQRRYLVKKSYVFGHSQKAYKENTIASSKYNFSIPLTFLMFFGVLIDWKEVWIQYVPNPLKRLVYDNCFRPVRRLWWNIVHRDKSTTRPDDLSFDELDKSHYEKTIYERRKEEFFKKKPRSGGEKPGDK